MAKRRKKDAIDIVSEARELNDKEAELAAAKERGDKETEQELSAIVHEARADLYSRPGPSALSQFKDRGKDGQVSDFWAEQANWNRRTGETPLEFLTRVYRNPLVDMDTRVKAARDARDLVHKHLPNLTVNIDGNEAGPGSRSAGTRERIMERILGLAREPEEAGKGGNPSSKGGNRKAQR